MIANKCLWLKTRPHFTLPFTEKKVSICLLSKLTKIFYSECFRKLQ